MLRSIYSSLKPGGNLILVDPFSVIGNYPVLTNAGARGSLECKGYPSSVLEFLTLARDSGFVLDHLSDLMVGSNRVFLTIDDLSEGANNLGYPLAISKAVWYFYLQK